MRATLAVAGVVVGMACAVVGVAPTAGAGARGSTVTRQGFTFTLKAPDDICGPYPSTVTFHVRNEVLHWTERPDGTFNVQFSQTGTYSVDFDDPDRADQQSQYTESVHHVLTPGQGHVFNLAFHDFPDDIKIWERVHVTFVGDEMVVERVTFEAVGCP